MDSELDMGYAGVGIGFLGGMSKLNGFPYDTAEGFVNPHHNCQEHIRQDYFADNPERENRYPGGGYLLMSGSTQDHDSPEIWG